MPEIKPKRGEQRESTELTLELSRDDRTLLILTRLMMSDTRTSELAGVALEQLTQSTSDSTTIEFKDPTHSVEWIRALRYEIDRERLNYGDESVPERQEFLERRRPVQEATRRLRTRLQLEYKRTTTETLTEAEQRESVIYQEVGEIVANVSEAMGFRRPVLLELTRSTDMNAYVLRTEKLDEDYTVPSTEPVHVFVNIGFITQLHKMFVEQKKVFTKDHLA
ncbi:MAG: hypothetical protein WCV88_04005 [Patescibacteria group bacterium]